MVQKGEKREIKCEKRIKLIDKIKKYSDINNIIVSKRYKMITVTKEVSIYQFGGCTMFDPKPWI